MPRPRAAMRKIREALRLCLAEGLSPRQAGIATGLPRTTVRRYVVRAVEVGLGWPLPPELDDRALEERLYGRAAPRADGPAPSRTGRRSTASSGARASPSSSCGPSTGRAAPTASGTPGSPSGTGPSPDGSTSSCATTTGPARRPSSTSPARPSRSPTRRPARSGAPSSSWRSSARRTTRTPRPWRPRRCPTGSAPTSGPSSSGAAHPRSWSRTTCAVGDRVQHSPRAAPGDPAPRLTGALTARPPLRGWREPAKKSAAAHQGRRIRALWPTVGASSTLSGPPRVVAHPSNPANGPTRAVRRGCSVDPSLSVGREDGDFRSSWRQP